MHHTLKAYTDAGTFVFFDPGSVRYILRGEITLEAVRRRSLITA